MMAAVPNTAATAMLACGVPNTPVFQNTRPHERVTGLVQKSAVDNTPQILPSLWIMQVPLQKILKIAKHLQSNQISLLDRSSQNS